MSLIATQVHSILDELFPASPHKRVFAEHFVKYKGQRLFFDFYLRELGCFFECQGRQHVVFVKHFHGDVASFKAQKYRDNLKIEYVQENNLYLVRINDGEDVTKELVLDRINKAFDSEYNFSD